MKRDPVIISGLAIKIIFLIRTVFISFINKLYKIPKFIKRDPVIISGFLVIFSKGHSYSISMLTSVIIIHIHTQLLHCIGVTDARLNFASV